MRRHGSSLNGSKQLIVVAANDHVLSNHVGHMHCSRFVPANWFAAVGVDYSHALQ